MSCPTPTPRFDVGPDPNAPVTVPAWLFERLLASSKRPTFPTDALNSYREPRPVDLAGITSLNIPDTPGEYPSESGGGVPNVFAGWTPVGRNSTSRQSGSMDAEPEGND